MWARRATRARLLAARYPASREILIFYAGLAEWQGEAAARAVSPHELLPGLVELVLRTGPTVLQQAASGLLGLPELDAPPPLDFFARAARQPLAAAQQITAATAEAISPRCSWCGQPPQAGALRPEGDGLALELVCSLCFRRWLFPRLRCPACGESAEGRLVLYSAPEFEHLGLEACETCHTYLQLVDLRRDTAQSRVRIYSRRRA
ncbi:MAG: formate dehydrogenase accessory protein FdhE [Acidobacteria bacterium]|nr:formate dehydrogenase accessory protein FdhE [Acidobacteriota bacterium]